MRHALIKLFSPFQFAASVWTSIECLTLKSLATSSVVVRESVWIFPSFGCCQLPIVDPTPLIIFFLIFSFTWILFHFLKIYFHWRVITLQYRGGFCHTSTWSSHGCTCVPPSWTSLPLPSLHPSGLSQSTSFGCPASCIEPALVICWLVGSPCSPRDSQESSPTPQFRSNNSSALSLLHSPTLTSIHDHWKKHSLD